MVPEEDVARTRGQLHHVHQLGHHVHAAKTIRIGSVKEASIYYMCIIMSYHGVRVE